MRLVAMHAMMVSSLLLEAGVSVCILRTRAVSSWPPLNRSLARRRNATKARKVPRTQFGSVASKTPQPGNRERMLTSARAAHLPAAIR